MVPQRGQGMRRLLPCVCPAELGCAMLFPAEGRVCGRHRWRFLRLFTSGTSRSCRLVVVRVLEDQPCQYARAGSCASGTDATTRAACSSVCGRGRRLQLRALPNLRASAAVRDGYGLAFGPRAAASSGDRRCQASDNAAAPWRGTGAIGCLFVPAKRQEAAGRQRTSCLIGHPTVVLGSLEIAVDRSSGGRHHAERAVPPILPQWRASSESSDPFVHADCRAVPRRPAYKIAAFLRACGRNATSANPSNASPCLLVAPRIAIAKRQLR